MRRFAMSGVAWKYVLVSPEAMVIAAIIVFSIFVGIIEPNFFSLATLFNIVRNGVVELTFALGVMLILVSGGIDVSFDAIGIFAGYTVITLAVNGVFGGSIWIAYTLAALIGLSLGLVNAAAVVLLRLPVLIVTLGTRGVFAGVLLSFIGANYFHDLPGQLHTVGSASLVSAALGHGHSVGLTVQIIPVVILVVLIAWFVRKSMLGRTVYAIGGNAATARQIGLPVTLTRVVVFAIAGMLAGIAGIMHVTLLGYANPYDLVGNELNVLAAIVLGGTYIFGGRGTVLGTVLGVVLIELIGYSLILLSIPSAWQQASVGVILLLGIGAQSLTRRSQRRAEASMT